LEPVAPERFMRPIVPLETASADGSIAAYGVFGFPGSRKGAFAVAPMLGELEKAMVSDKQEPTR
jgi:hypothetical protein